MAEIVGLFDAFYSRLLLRDVFGKIVPGTVFLVVIGSTIFSLSFLTSFVQSMSFGMWALFLGAAWITAFGIQAFGEKTRLIQYHSKKSDDRFYKQRNRLDLRGEQIQKQQFERFVVIKEACGNGYVTLLLSIVVVLIDRLIDVGTTVILDWTKSHWHVIAVLGLLTYFLRDMHFVSIKRQDSYLKTVVDDDW